MNILGRESLNDYSVTRSGNKVNRFDNFSDIKRFLSVGFSTIYTATAQVDGRNGIAKGDRVYFKINNEIGVSNLGRIDESSGSCEDVAEVMGFYALRNLQRKLGKESVLKATPYDFADYEHDSFVEVISKKTNNFVDSDRLYGCLSKNCLSSNSEIIHGDALLSLVVPNSKVLASSNNTLFNYDCALVEFFRRSASCGQHLIIDPISTRYLANTLFWDYFFSNSDRHCKNINFEKVPLDDNRFLVTPLAIIDNGGGLCLQNSNCKKLFEMCGKDIIEQGSYLTRGVKASPFNVPYEFSIGRDSLPNGDFKDAYGGLSASEEIVVLISGNKTLYDDFANMYRGLDFNQVLLDMKSELKFNPNFLPNLSLLANQALDLRRVEISRSMADFMCQEFKLEEFLQDPNYYLDRFEAFVEKDNLNLHIATNEEVEEFREFINLDSQQNDSFDHSTTSEVDNMAEASTYQNNVVVEDREYSGSEDSLSSVGDDVINQKMQGVINQQSSVEDVFCSSQEDTPILPS